MKSLILLISIIMVSFVLNDGCSGTASKYDDCKGKKTSDSTAYCCYVESEGTVLGKKKTSKECEELSKAEYDNIKDYVKTQKQLAETFGAKDVDMDIDCESSYLKICLLSLIIFLI